MFLLFGSDFDGWYGKAEGRAVSELALRPPPSPVRRHDPGGYGKTEAGALVLDVIAAPVPFEEVFQIIFSDARTIVCNREPELADPAPRLGG